MFRRTRLNFTSPVKREALLRSKGICECGRVPTLMKILNNKPCGRPLSTGNVEYDHIICDAMRPDNSLENCAALTKTCHAIKTPRDQTNIADVKRQNDRHFGIKPEPREVLLGTIKSGIKKPMSGAPPVWRDTGRQWSTRR